MFLKIFIFNNCIVIKPAGDRSRRRPEGSLFNSYYTEV